MHNKKTSPNELAERRRFLKRLAGASAAVGLAGAAGQAIAAPQETQALATEESKQGYRETDHVRAYYASCR